MNIKSIVASVALVGVLGIGGIFAYGAINDSADGKTKQTNSNEIVTSASEPTERTVDGINAGGYPWEYLSRETIDAEISNGEVVHLYADGEALENAILDFTQADFEETATSQEDVAESWAEHVKLYIGEVEHYRPDQSEYFAKMNEVSAALSSREFESLPNLINEAKELRGAN